METSILEEKRGLLKIRGHETEHKIAMCTKNLNDPMAVYFYKDHTRNDI